jgi:hypothetical protein
MVGYISHLRMNDLEQAHDKTVLDVEEIQDVVEEHIGRWLRGILWSRDQYWL